MVSETSIIFIMIYKNNAVRRKFAAHGAVAVYIFQIAGLCSSAKEISN